ncbi:MAG: site-2 protease family protein [Candidatus Margulisiibacteriota bacterium]
MFDLSFIVLTIPIILIALTIHEFSHAKVADILGDPTPRMAGRLSLNPIAHIDPIGFIMLLLVRFGWAKPVPINPYNFRNPKMGNLLVSLAGPLSNFIFAWLVAIVLKNVPLPEMLGMILSYTIWINLSLAIFNLIPIPPLDGSHILEFFLSPYQMEAFYRLQAYGYFLLLAILFFGSPLLIAVIEFVYRLLV